MIKYFIEQLRPDGSYTPMHDTGFYTSEWAIACMNEWARELGWRDMRGISSDGINVLAESE